MTGTLPCLKSCRCPRLHAHQVEERIAGPRVAQDPGVDRRGHGDLAAQQRVLQADQHQTPACPAPARSRQATCWTSGMLHPLN